MRMAIRHFTRLTNAFSKKVEDHAHSVAIHFMHYNFVRGTRPFESPGNGGRAGRQMVDDGRHGCRA